MLEKIKTHKPIAIGAAIIAVILLGALIRFGAGAPQRRYDRALELGEQYLVAGNYEQAVLQFATAITVLDKNESLGDREALEERLTTALYYGALEIAKADGLGPAAQWLEDLGYGDIDLPVPFIDAVTLLEELQAACAAEDYDTVFAHLADQSYKRMVAAVMGADCEMKLIDDSGMMTAIYRMEVDTENFADATYMVYYGNQTDGMRAGEALWIGYQNGNNYVASGTWDADAPNGEFETRSWQADLNETVVYRIVSGKVIDGLWDGTVQWRFDRGTSQQAYAPAFSKGKWQIIREEGGYSIVADNGGDDLLITTEPETLNGIAGYAPAA